jgi:hypothetical protein
VLRGVALTYVAGWSNAFGQADTHRVNGAFDDLLELEELAMAF